MELDLPKSWFPILGCSGVAIASRTLLLEDFSMTKAGRQGPSARNENSREASANRDGRDKGAKPWSRHAHCRNARFDEDIPPGQITRLDIARAAGVDPALIRYYFGDKSALFVTAVSRPALKCGNVRPRTLAKRDGSRKVRRRIVVLLETLYQDPSLHHLDHRADHSQ